VGNLSSLRGRLFRPFGAGAISISRTRLTPCAFILSPVRGLKRNSTPLFSSSREFPLQVFIGRAQEKSSRLCQLNLLKWVDTHRFCEVIFVVPLAVVQEGVDQRCHNQEENEAEDLPDIAGFRGDRIISDAPAQIRRG
jgi:hypothetical protein